ncbi:unnamed protein product, partial [Discosporangium mesarthrocarpum]
MPHEFLGGDTPCERLTGKPFNYDRLRIWGAECFVHQHKQVRDAASKFHPYAKRGVLVGHDRTSLCWHVWLPQEAKLVTTAHITFHPEERLLDIVGEPELMEMSDDEDGGAKTSDDEGLVVKDTPLESPELPTSTPTSETHSHGRVS